MRFHCLVWDCSTKGETRKKKWELVHRGNCQTLPLHVEGQGGKTHGVNATSNDELESRQSCQVDARRLNGFKDPPTGVPTAEQCFLKAIFCCVSQGCLQHSHSKHKPIEPAWTLKLGSWPVLPRLYPATKSALSTAKSGAWATGNARDLLVEPNNASFSAFPVPRTWSQEAEGKVCSSTQGSEASRHSLSLKSCVMESWQETWQGPGTSKQPCWKGFQPQVNKTPVSEGFVQ